MSKLFAPYDNEVAQFREQNRARRRLRILKTLYNTQIILGDPGAVSRVRRKGGTKVFKYGWKSPWVTTLTGPFPKIQADAGSWLGTKKALYYCAQSANTSPEFFSCVRTGRLLSRHTCPVRSPCFSLQQVFTLASTTACVNIYREFLKDTTMADSHENVVWKSEFFQSLSWLVQHAYYVKCKQTLLELNFYQPYPSPWGEWILSLRVYVLHKTCSRAVDGKELYKKAWCTCKVVVLPCQA